MEIIELQRLENPGVYINCILSKLPTDPGCFIVFTQSCSSGQTVYRIADNTLFEVDPEKEAYQVHAMVSFKGVIYGLIDWGYDDLVCEFVTFYVVGDKLEARSLLIDGEFPWEVYNPAPGIWCIMNIHYFVESPSGNELLLVTQTAVDIYIDSGMHFRVFRLDVGRMEFEELENLDGLTIFIGYYGNGFCRSSESLGSEIKSNCIYYTNSRGAVIYVYDLDDRSTVTLQPYPGAADIDPIWSSNYWVDLPNILTL